MRTKTLKTRLATITMACTMVVTAMTSTAMTASAATWRTGRFNGNNNTSAITVSLTNTRKNAKVKIHAYGTIGWPTKHKERDCKLYVTMRNTRGGWIWGGDINTGSRGKTMNLGCDNSVYRLYLKHPYSYRCWDVGHCCPDEWAVECTKNCSVK